MARQGHWGIRLDLSSFHALVSLNGFKYVRVRPCVPCGNALILHLEPSNHGLSSHQRQSRLEGTNKPVGLGAFLWCCSFVRPVSFSRVSCVPLCTGRVVLSTMAMPSLEVKVMIMMRVILITDWTLSFGVLFPSLFKYLFFCTAVVFLLSNHWHSPL